MITLPELTGPVVTGLPVDQHGFILVDSCGRVPSCPDVFAAGDATTFALKQGGLATQQADVVAEAIASELGVALEAKPFSPVLRGLLLTGGAPLYLRSEPQRVPRQSTVAVEATPLRRTSKDCLGSRRPAAVVAAGQDRRALPGAVPGHRASPAAVL